MEISISPTYLIILFILWIAPVINAVWGGPVWITISFMAFFAIYAGHEWIHVWICRIHDMTVHKIFLNTGGETHIIFEESTGPNKDRDESDVYLAGVAWDSIFFTISSLSAIFFSLFTGDPVPLTFGCSLILLLIFNLAVPGSDWQEYKKRSPLRA